MTSASSDIVSPSTNASTRSTTPVYTNYVVAKQPRKKGDLHKRCPSAKKATTHTCSVEQVPSAPPPRSNYILSKKGKKRAKLAKHQSSSAKKTRTIGSDAKQTATSEGLNPPLFGIASQLTVTKGKLPYLKKYNEVYLGLNPDTDGTSQTGESPLSAWKAESLTAAKRCCHEFGPPRKDASFTQEGCMETSLHLLLNSGYLPAKGRTVLLGTHVLIKHLDKMRRALLPYNFSGSESLTKTRQIRQISAAESH